MDDRDRDRNLIVLKIQPKHTVLLVLSPIGRIDFKPGGRNRFAFADWTASGSIQPSPFPERKPAVLTSRRFNGEVPRMNRFGNVLEVIKDFSFSNPKQFRNLLRIKIFRVQSFSNLFPQG